MSDTPETDEQFKSFPAYFEIDLFCRKLERERDEAREVASGLSIQEERVNEAQKELSSIHRWIDKNHADGFIDSLTYLQNLERVADNWYDRIDAIETDARRFVRERDEAREKAASWIREWRELRELWRTLDRAVNNLMRERDEARHKLELCMAANSDVARIAKERDEAREELNRYKRQWEESRSENVEGAK